MISSPCRDCKNQNLPKDECIKTCALIQAIQSLQVARGETNVYSAVDYSEENRFQIVSPFGSALSAC